MAKGRKMTDQKTLDASGESLLSGGLERCPHCGSNVLYGPHLTEYIGDHREPHWWLNCTNCPAEMTVYDEAVEALIDAWNKRPNEPAKGRAESASSDRKERP